METVKDKGERMQEMLAKLERAQSSMDERLQQCNMAKTALTAEIATTDKLFTRSNAENMAAEDKMLAVLGEQMTVQKGSAGAATHIQKKQKAVLPPSLLYSVNPLRAYLIISVVRDTLYGHRSLSVYTYAPQHWSTPIRKAVPER